MKMSKNSSRPVGRHFLHIPGPTPLPDRVLRAMDTPIIDHRGPEFAKLAKNCLEGVKTIFKTTNPVVIYTATGTGAWEAALVNTLSPTAYRHDEWGVDVTIGGAQKGLMLPPGMSFNTVSDKAFAAAKSSQLTKSFWAWDDMLAMNKIGFFPYTPATQMLHGLSESIAMLHEEGLENVFARHHRLAEATRRAVRAWGLEIMCREAKYYSPTVTAVLLPDGHDADAFRNFALDTFNISYGSSFGRYAGKYFRIGHPGGVNEGMITGALAIWEMTLGVAGIPHKKGGVQAALDYLIAAQESPARAAAE